MKKFLFLFLAVLFLSACVSKTEEKMLATSTETIVSVSETDSLSLSNPASVNCITMKGELKIVTKADGSQYGVCYFMDNRQCEEWSLLRGDCPINGRKITGYETEAQRYCAITGGEVDMNKNTCYFKDKTCDLDKYYNNSCDK